MVFRSALQVEVVLAGRAVGLNAEVCSLSLWEHLCFFGILSRGEAGGLEIALLKKVEVFLC